MKIYARALENRIHGGHPTLTAGRSKFLKAVGLNLLMIQVLFFCLFAYIYGSLFQQSSHVHNINILFVDYDQGAIGEAVRNAYNTLEGSSFPTVIEKSVSDFPTPGDLRGAVCRVQCWAALYVPQGASDQVRTALSESSATNITSYLTYIWNEARYATIADSLIAQNVQELSSNAQAAWIRSLRGEIDNSTNLDVLASPWRLVSENIQPTVQGSRVIYNTLVIILILIQDFFFLAILNGLYLKMKFYTRVYPRRIIVYRTGISAIYTFVGSLLAAGALWAFRVGWHVDSNQFALTWMALWLFSHLSYLALDVFSIWLDPAFLPMSLITWVVLNVTSILVPFELMPGFYRWSYAMPANATYRVLIDIWSRGCNPQLYYALPILFSLEIVSFLLSAVGVYRRCHYAVIAEETEEKAFRARMDAEREAMANQSKTATEDITEEPDLEELELSFQRSMVEQACGETLKLE